MVRRVREAYPSLMLPVILVSASGREEQVVEGLSAGASDYITKPFGARELVARVTAQLRNKAYAEAAAAQTSGAAPAREAQGGAPVDNGTAGAPANPA